MDEQKNARRRGFYAGQLIVTEWNTADDICSVGTTRWILLPVLSCIINEVKEDYDHWSVILKKLQKYGAASP